ncbi:MAG: ABC transporter ATP-binding protein [Candidatus Helarchaeota archaeon]
MVKNMIELKNVVKVYDLGVIKVRALKGVTLTVKEREFTVIMGPSGSGKTTLLNMIGALDRPTAGRIIVDGADITDYEEGRLANYRGRKIGSVFQFFNLLTLLTARENVELPMLFSGDMDAREAREKAKELLTLVGLGDRLNHRPTELSGGQQQRVSIARAFANDPALILCDEPTGSVDTATGVEVLRLMKRLNRELGQTFVIVTHDPGVAGVSSRSIYVVDGKISEDVPQGVAPPSDHIAKRMYETTQTKIAKLEASQRELQIYKNEFELFLKRKEELDPVLFRKAKEEYVQRISHLQQRIMAEIAATKEVFIFDQFKKRGLKNEE